MTYRNKTYVAFASEDINYYQLMRAWKATSHIDFDFFDAHDLNVARDTSTPETIRRRLRERLVNTKQTILLGSPNARRKGTGTSFFAYEVEAILSLDLPVVIANLDGYRRSRNSEIPQPLVSADHYTMSVSFQAAIVKFALDKYVPSYSSSGNSGQYYYEDHVYARLGL